MAGSTRITLENWSPPEKQTHPAVARTRASRKSAKSSGTTSWLRLTSSQVRMLRICICMAWSLEETLDKSAARAEVVCSEETTRYTETTPSTILSPTRETEGSRSARKTFSAPMASVKNARGRPENRLHRSRTTVGDTKTGQTRSALTSLIRFVYSSYETVQVFLSIRKKVSKRWNALKICFRSSGRRRRSVKLARC